MKKLALASGLALALSPVLAHAGGEIVVAPPPPPQPVAVPPAVTPPAPAPVVAPAPPVREGGPYAAIYGGANWLDDTDFDGGEADFDTGFVVGGAVGYGVDVGTFTPRVELDVAYRDNDIDDLTIGSVDAIDPDGDVTALSGLVNAWVDVPIGGRIKPYVGGGLGAARVEIDDVSAVGLSVDDDDDTVFAWQLGAGVAYQFTPSVAATVDYRWFNAEDPSFNDDVDIDYESHSAMAGLRFNF